jgi:uncharacterized protein (DUF3084 family)
LEEASLDIQTLRDENMRLVPPGVLDAERKRLDVLEQSLAQHKDDLVRREQDLQSAHHDVGQMQQHLANNDQVVNESEETEKVQDELIVNLERSVKAAEAAQVRRQEEFNQKNRTL